MRNSAGSAGSANLEGLLRESSAVREEVIDRAPPPDPNRQDIVLPPKASLKPSHLVSDWHRWSCVAQELGGKNTRQQVMQVGSIGVVILLRTMLQVLQLACLLTHPHSTHSLTRPPTHSTHSNLLAILCYRVLMLVAALSTNWQSTPWWSAFAVQAVGDIVLPTN